MAVHMVPCSLPDVISEYRVVKSNSWALPGILLKQKRKITNTNDPLMKHIIIIIWQQYLLICMVVMLKARNKETRLKYIEFIEWNLCVT